MKMYLSGKNAFSLIELMIAILIVGIISVTALPALQKYKIKARKAEAYVTTKTIMTGEKTYFNENNMFIGQGISNVTLLYDSSGVLLTGIGTNDTVLNLDDGGDASCFGGFGDGGTSITVEDFGAPAAPTGKYDFVYSVAMSPLTGTLSGSDLWFTRECYYVVQFLAVDSASANGFNESPLIEFSYKEDS
ncbi:MAG: prepilin-type N-terminal cleavage/methylation domain-containing protein [Bdellovibrionales bacterium]|nr:prepilin-type N-terminal cleavage/methylation domain-containing protein [Bdellovibrionales bacterium]